MGRKNLISKLSMDERAKLVIDKLVNNFEPKTDYDNLDIKKYEEDWKQELWLWCWEHREQNYNLKSLILNLNNLFPAEYTFHIRNVHSLMNRYIVSYIARLQYSSNRVAKYCMNDKFNEEQLYGDLTEIDDMNIEATEEPNYIAEDINITELNDRACIEKIIHILDKSKIRNINKCKTVIGMCYGLNSEGRVYSYEECGKYLNVSKQRINQILQKTFKYIRLHMKKEEL